MPGTILRELFAKLGLDVDAASFAKGQLAADGVKFALEKLVGWGKAAAEGLIDVAKEAVETAAHLDDTSQAIGVSTDALQELGYAAGQSGLEAAELQKSILLLSRTMNAAKSGGESQAELFQKLGVKIKFADGKLRPVEGVINDVADKLKKMPDGAEKTALAMEFFGKSGAKMLPMLNEGSEGIERMRQEARDLGLVLDKDLIKQGAEIDDLATSLKDMWKSIKTQVGASLFPDILRAGKAIKAWVTENRKLIQLNLVRFFRGLAKAGEIVYGVFSETFKMFERNLPIFGRAVLLIGAALIPTGLRIAAAWVLAAAPILALGAALTALVLFIDDFRLYLKYGDKAKTLTGQFLKNIDEWMKPKPGDPWWIKALREFLGLIREALIKLKELDALINGKKQHQEADKNAAADARDTTRLADTQTARVARQRLAAGLPLTAQEQDSLNRLRNSDSSQFFAMPSGNPADFATKTGAWTASPTIAKTAAGANGVRVQNNTFQPQVNINAIDGEEMANKVKRDLVPQMQDWFSEQMEDTAAEQD